MWNLLDRLEPLRRGLVSAAMLLSMASASPSLASDAIPSADQPAADTKKTETPANPALEPIADVAGLPRVLLIGDSISLGYTLDVRQMLAGRANVHRPPTNCGDTARGLQQIDAWLGDGRWDVIHFNWGLWDINRRVNGKRNLEGEVAATEAEYAERLEKLVERLKQTGAKLIWASTTYVQGGFGRRPGDEARYNAVAAEIMRKHGVGIDDLHAVSAKFPHFGKGPADQPEMFKSVGNVHFTPEGSKALAARVAASIVEALPKPGE